MKSLLLLTASGPLLILTSHKSATDSNPLQELKLKSVDKFVAVPRRHLRITHHLVHLPAHLVHLLLPVCIFHRRPHLEPRHAACGASWST